MNKVLFVCVVAIALGGCMSAGNQTLKAENEQTISEKMVEGTTTMNEVRSMFGSPLETNFTDGGLEIWKYVLSDVSSDAINYIPIINLFGGSASGTKKELVVLFDDNNIVKRFSMAESDVKTKTGFMN
jgi:outer membrane protein assembly factor BamE (lipoprotein component of BamABCDE complex)